MKEVVVVSGATGNVGRLVVERLLARGVGVRAMGRNADRLRALAGRGAQPFLGSLEHAPFLARALQGARAAFAMIPPNHTTPDLRSYQRRVAAAWSSGLSESGVTHVVSLSSVGAELPDGNGPIGGLHELEERLDGLLRLHTVHLRAAFFMENFLQNIGLIKRVRINGTPLHAQLLLPMIATRDIAAVAADLLSKLTFTGKAARELLGARDYTPAEATRILGKAIGNESLIYVAFPYADAHHALLGMGFSPSVAEGIVEMYRAINEGRVRTREKRSPVNTTPTTLEEFASTFAAAYQAA